MSRRAVLAGAAWSVPVVVVGSALPAHAIVGLSDYTPVELTSVDAACKFSSTKVYHFELTFTNTTDYYVRLYDWGLDAVPSSGTDIIMPDVPDQVFAPGESLTLVVNSYETENAASFDLRLHYKWEVSPNATLDPIFDSGAYPSAYASDPNAWSPPVGRFQNTPDCSAVPTAMYTGPAYRGEAFVAWF